MLQNYIYHFINNVSSINYIGRIFDTLNSETNVRISEGFTQCRILLDEGLRRVFDEGKELNDCDRDSRKLSVIRHKYTMKIFCTLQDV